MKPKPTRRPDESTLDYAARLNKWKKEQLAEARTKKNEQTKREYRIAPKETKQ
jgi:hypothetical protein